MRSLCPSPRSIWYAFVSSPCVILKPSSLSRRLPSTRFEVARIALHAREGCAEYVAAVVGRRGVAAVVGGRGGGRGCRSGRSGRGVVTLELLEEPGYEGGVVVGGNRGELVVDLLCSLIQRRVVQCRERAEKGTSQKRRLEWLLAELDERVHTCRLAVAEHDKNVFALVESITISGGWCGREKREGDVRHDGRIILCCFGGPS